MVPPEHLPDVFGGYPTRTRPQRDPDPTERMIYEQSSQQQQRWYFNLAHSPCPTVNERSWVLSISGGCGAVGVSENDVNVVCWSLSNKLVEQLKEEDLQWW